MHQKPPILRATVSEPTDESVASSTTETRRQERRERFVRVAAKRTQQVLDRLRLLAKCSNRAVYEYGEADVSKIFDTIGEEVAAAHRKFEDRTRKRVEFKL